MLIQPSFIFHCATTLERRRPLFSDDSLLKRTRRPNSVCVCLWRLCSLPALCCCVTMFSTSLFVILMQERAGRWGWGGRHHFLLFQLVFSLSIKQHFVDNYRSWLPSLHKTQFRARGSLLTGNSRRGFVLRAVPRRNKSRRWFCDSSRKDGHEYLMQILLSPPPAPLFFFVSLTQLRAGILIDLPL